MKMKKFFFIITSLTCISINASAQFEHRFSATLSSGVASTFSTVEALDIFGDNIPAAFGNFEPGSFFSLGFHFNPGKRFALIIIADIAGFNNWNYNYEDYSNDDYLINYNNSLNARRTGFGIAPRLYLNPRSKVRVYMQIKACLSQLSLTYDSWDGDYKFLDNTMAIGIEPAFGLDIRIGERFGLFFQNSIEFDMYNENEFPTSFFNTSTGYDQSIGLQKDNLNMFKLELGARYNFLKSKKI